jgi:hypothetical protein
MSTTPTFDISYKLQPGSSVYVDHSVTHLLDGSFIVAWTEGDTSPGGNGSDLFFRRYDWDGETVIGDLATRINTYTLYAQQRPRLLAIDDWGALYGGFNVVWESTSLSLTNTPAGQDGSYGGIYGQLMTYDGTK